VCTSEEFYGNYPSSSREGTTICSPSEFLEFYWFRNAGLKESTVHTFVGDIHAPLGDDIRSALISLIKMRWGEPQSEVTQDDWVEYQRLCRPESPDFILNLSGYYGFFTYSMFHGKVAK
jgi:hypothetical protein